MKRQPAIIPHSEHVSRSHYRGQKGLSCPLATSGDANLPTNGHKPVSMGPDSRQR